MSKLVAMKPPPKLNDVHKHSWQPVGIVHDVEKSYSPVSIYDHQYRDIELAITSCSCGAIKRTVVARGRWKWLNK
jgi:hypothetical protein